MLFPFQKLANSDLGYRIIYLIVSLILAGIMLSIFLRNSGINQSDRATFSNMVYGKAHKPFVYRTLLPTSVRLITAIIPSNIRTIINQQSSESQIPSKVFRFLRWEQQVDTKRYFIESSIAIALMFLSLGGFIFALRYFISGLFDAPKLFTDIIPLIAVIFLYPFFTFGYLYDFPSLLLFTLGLAFMLRERWRLFLLIFLLTSLNKETSFLLTLIYIPFFLEKKKLDKRLFRNLFLMQIGIYLLIKFVLFLIFINNPGTVSEFHLVENSYKILLQIWLHPLSTGLGWIALAFFVFYKWAEKPDFLKYSLWIYLPLFLLYLLFGNYGELRVFYEVFPIIVLLIAHTVSRLVGIKLIPIVNNKLTNTTNLVKANPE